MSPRIVSIFVYTISVTFSSQLYKIHHCQSLYAVHSPSLIAITVNFIVYIVLVHYLSYLCNIYIFSFNVYLCKYRLVGLMSPRIVSIFVYTISVTFSSQLYKIHHCQSLYAVHSPSLIIKFVARICIDNHLLTITYDCMHLTCSYSSCMHINNRNFMCCQLQMTSALYFGRVRSELVFHVTVISQYG